MSELVTTQTMQPRISKNGKRLWNKAQKQLIVAETMKPGASVSKVSRQYDINANQIFHWIKLAEARSQKNKQQIVPIGVIGAPPIPETCGVTTPRLIEIELPGGIKVRIDDDVRMPVLKSVLDMLRGHP
jgi:transposase